MMFQLGLEAWSRQVASEGEQLMSELGMEPGELRDMSPNEVVALLQSKTADPERQEAVARFYAEHPLLGDQVRAEFEQMRNRAMSLLQRLDSHVIQLGPEETQPWFDILIERLEPLYEALNEADEDATLESLGLQDKTAQIIRQLAAEMFPVIFTGERIDQLIENAAEYRRTLLALNETAAAADANGWVLVLKQADANPTEPLLVSLCWVALQRALAAAAEAEDDEEGKVMRSRTPRVPTRSPRPKRAWPVRLVRK